MEWVYSSIVLAIIVGRWFLEKIIDVGEEDMRDTHANKWYLIGSWVLLIPILVLVWIMDQSRPNPIWPFMFAVLYCFRGYMEWTYIRDSRRHQVSFLLAAFLFSFTILLLAILLVQGPDRSFDY
ncbi:protein of unknown function [Paenibacillus sp. cl141a]|nr:DUF4181 domain-containing protein [Paenibacillus sp. cl141a]SEM62023.1 protein of unknown function [Paenibacillus sp. cl141a]